MTAFREAADAARWGDVTGVLVRFAIDHDRHVALGRVALTFDPRRCHDLAWVFRLRGRITRLEGDRPAHADEREVARLLRDLDWDTSRGRVGRLPLPFTGGIEVYLWDLEVALSYLPDGVHTQAYRENALLPCQADRRNPSVVRALPYTRPMRERRPGQFLEAIRPHAVPLKAALVQANAGLLRAGAETLPATVLITFARDIPSPWQYLCRLAGRAGEVKGCARPHDPDEQVVWDALWAAERRAVYYRRIRLPPGFTGGPVVYAADLWMYRPYLRGGVVDFAEPYAVLAEPGDEGGIELLPSGPEEVLDAVQAEPRR